MKADQLGDVMEEYRARLARGTEAECYRTAFKKIQALYLLKAEPQQETSSGGGFVRTGIWSGGAAGGVGVLGRMDRRSSENWTPPRFGLPKLVATATVFVRTGFFTFLSSLLTTSSVFSGPQTSSSSDLNEK